ncbi:unnamed protein product [Jaminaea pallidilutea]
MDKDTVQKAQNLLQHAEATKYPDDLTALVQVLSDEMEDPKLAFDHFDSEQAMLLGTTISLLWRQMYSGPPGKSGGIVISISTWDGQQLFSSAVGAGFSGDNFEWLKRKTNTVQRFGTSSWLRGRSRAAKGREPDDPLLGPDFAAHGGAFPIRLKNLKDLTIGAVAVSGMTQPDDHEIVVAAVRALVSQQSK